MLNQKYKNFRKNKKKNQTPSKFALRKKSI